MPTRLRRGTRIELFEGGDVRCEGSIPEQITKAAEVIEEWVPKVQALAPSGRFEARPIIPRDVWLEGLVNAVLHRSYSNAGDHVRVEIFPTASRSRTLAASPAWRIRPSLCQSADMHVTHVSSASVPTSASRENSAKASSASSPDAYSRPDRPYLLARQWIGRSRPSASADALDEGVRASLTKAAQLILDILRLEARPLSTGQIANLAGIARPTASRNLQTLRKLGLVDWDGQGPRDPRASWTLR